jgi:anthranilate/para-aminobenzoate synthase component I
MRNKKNIRMFCVPLNQSTQILWETRGISGYFVCHSIRVRSFYEEQEEYPDILCAIQSEHAVLMRNKRNIEIFCVPFNQNTQFSWETRRISGYFVCHSIRARRSYEKQEEYPDILCAVQSEYAVLMRNKKNIQIFCVPFNQSTQFSWGTRRISRYFACQSIRSRSSYAEQKEYPDMLYAIQSEHAVLMTNKRNIQIFCVPFNHSTQFLLGTRRISRYFVCHSIKTRSSYEKQEEYPDFCVPLNFIVRE